MKQILLLLTVVSFALQLKAQLVKDEWGKIVPFSMVDKYKAEIETHDIPSFVIPFMDNDSLCKRYNKGKSIEELGFDFVGGIDLQHESISLKENGVCIKLKKGNLWRYAIEGSSVEDIGFDFGFPKLSSGAYIAVIPADTTVSLIQHIRVYHSENLLERHKKRGLTGSIYGKRVVIEYYEPYVIQDIEDVVIRSITYGFVGFGNRRSSSYNDLELKSGFWGDSEYSGCQEDVICSNHQNEAKSVVYLNLKYKVDEFDDGTLQTRYRNGTGFFLNKVGGYNSNDYALMVTSGHLYSFEKNSGATVDIINDIDAFRVVTKYQNKECGTNDTNIGGIDLDCSFNRNALGSSYNLVGLPLYSPNKDYAVLQADVGVDALSKYDLEYGAWSNNHDFNSSNNVGYFCIHHPKGDLKKINTDNDRASLVTFDGFELKYDIGLTEGGSSGAPVFNSSGQIVGFHVAESGDKGCNLIGQMKSINGTFNDLYSEFFSILDSEGTGEATSSNPQPPSASELPDHCKDCAQNFDETGSDCGGSCFPCGVQGDVLTLKTESDLLGIVQSRYEIFAEPDPGTLLALKSGYSSLEAGLNVHLNGGFEVKKGAAFYAGIDAELMSAADRGCQTGCLYVPNCFTPDGDGQSDYWGFRQAFVDSYSIRIFDRDNKTYLSKTDVPVYQNKFEYIWDGEGADPSLLTVYYYTITYTDCLGNTETEPGFFHIHCGLKSASTSSDIEVITDIKEIEENADNQIKVFPNPFMDKVKIQYSGNTFPLEYRITDLSGKVILNKKVNKPNEEIDLSGVSPGAYIINAKAGECNLVQKLIKK